MAFKIRSRQCMQATRGSAEWSTSAGTDVGKAAGQEVGLVNSPGELIGLAGVGADLLPPELTDLPQPCPLLRA